MDSNEIAARKGGFGCARAQSSQQANKSILVKTDRGLTPTNPSKQQQSLRRVGRGFARRRHRTAAGPSLSGDSQPQSPPEPGAHDRSRWRATSASFTAFITSTHRRRDMPTHICSERSRRLPPLLFAAHFAKHFSVILVIKSRCACACTSLRSCCSAAACCSAADICDSDSGYWRFAGVNSLLAIARDERVVLTSELVLDNLDCMQS